MKNLPPDFFGTLRYYAIEIATTIIFLWGIGKSVLHELGQ
jgi:hypothetical protein